jgi:hypothetical protein
MNSQQPAGPAPEQLADRAAGAAGHLVTGVSRLVCDVILDAQKVSRHWTALQLSLVSSAIRLGSAFRRTPPPR